MPDTLTEDEKRVLKKAAFGAVVLVSQVDPGLMDALRESFAAADELIASPLVREVIGAGGHLELDEMPLPELEAQVLPALRESVDILRAKAPEEVGHYTAAVMAACERAASGSGRVTGAERAALAKVGAALDSG